MKLISLLLSMTLVLMIGCGKKSLSDEEKSTLSSTLESVGRVRRSADQTQSNRNKMALGAVTEQQNDEATSKMATKISEKVSSGECKFEWVMPTQQSEQGNLKIAVSGEKCPVVYSLDVSFQATQTENSTSENVKLSAQYKVQDEDFASLNDITAMDVKGEGSFQSTVEGTTVRTKGSLEMSGSLHSRQHGDIQVSMTLTQDGKSQEQVLNLEYPDFDVELKAVSDDEGKVEYSLNGDSLSKEEWEALHKKAGDLFQTSARSEASSENSIWSNR